MKTEVCFTYHIEQVRSAEPSAGAVINGTGKLTHAAATPFGEHRPTKLCFYFFLAPHHGHSNSAALKKSGQENNKQNAFCGLQKCPQFERDCEKHEKTIKLLKNFPRLNKVG